MTPVELPDEVLEAVAALRRDDELRGRPAEAGEESLGSVLPCFVQQVHLVDDHDGGTLEELGAERAELAPEGVQRHRPGVRPVAAVEHVQQQRRALDVRQEAVPRPAPSLAPSMSPGMSAITAVPSPRYSTPRLGSMVVNG